ncbi:MAG: hypothetical protein JWM57_4002 [Phycisphaerales bacterium]|nr:hypothetical protein [Phycisphaerales bacterium]
MSLQDLDQTLRNLTSVAEPVRRGGSRETWRFQHAGRAYFLHFYLPTNNRLTRGAAAKEFAALKTLQTLKLPAVRPVALLSGLQFGERKGDAVLTAAIEPATRFDAIAPTDHVKARQGVINWLGQFAKAGLGHADLKPSSFLLTGDGVMLADAVGLVQDGLLPEHLMQFAHAAGDTATLADRVRAWRALVPNGDEAPPRDRHSARRLRHDSKSAAVEHVVVGEWKGWFLAAGKPVEWSVASQVRVTAQDWQREWPILFKKLRNNELDVLKRDISGDVQAGQVTLGGVTVDVILKRPRNKYWYRYLYDLFRPSRARRTWTKTLRLFSRGLPIERPLMVIQKRSGEFTAEAIAIFERVPGQTLEELDLSSLSENDRENLFRRCGRSLRKIEAGGLAHIDAKSSNWIIFPSKTAGPVPIIIDAYGVRRLNHWLAVMGLHRLLRAMKKHPQYTPADSLHLCQGFAPRATPSQTGPEVSDAH